MLTKSTEPECLPTVKEFLRVGCEEAIFFRSAQLYVSQRGRVVADEAFGWSARHGESVKPTHIFKTYCANKPAVGILAAILHTREILNWEEPLSTIWKDYPVCQATTRQVLSHQAGLPAVRPPVALLPTEVGTDYVLQLLRELPSVSLPAPTAYSQFLGWALLDMAFGALLGTSTSGAVRSLVLEPLGVNDMWLGFPPAEFAQNGPRIVLNQIERQQGAMAPLTGEATEPECTARDLGSNGYANMRALGNFYEALLSPEALARRLQVPIDLVCELTKPQGPKSYDTTQGRECQYGLGFMVNLGDHHFGKQVSQESFGHSAAAGCSFAFADPQCDLVVAVHTNGISAGWELAVESRRPYIIDSIYRELSLT